MAFGPLQFGQKSCRTPKSATIFGARTSKLMVKPLNPQPFKPWEPLGHTGITGGILNPKMRVLIGFSAFENLPVRVWMGLGFEGLGLGCQR